MIAATDAVARPSDASAPSRPDASVALASATQPLDELAESPPDAISSYAEQISRRAAVVLLRQQSIQTDLQLKLDRMRSDFNAAQEVRTEQMREMNALRDMAVEQGKKDDEILKKYIAMI